MKDTGSFYFAVSGWLDRNDVQFWDKTHSSWFKLFGRPDPEVLVEAEIGCSENPFDEKSTCTFYPKDEGNESLIHVSAILPRERYCQIYETLCRFQSRLEMIEVAVAYKKKPNSDTECSVEEIIFMTRSGDYFSDSSKEKPRKLGSWFSRR